MLNAARHTLTIQPSQSIVLDHAASHIGQSELEEKTARHYEDRRNGEYREWLALRYHEPTHACSVEAMKQVKPTGTLIEKAMRARPAAGCEFCATLIDKGAAVDEPILNLK